MPAQNIHQRLKELPIRDQKELTQLFDAIHADLTALRTSITGITAKLDADSGVGDTNYAALHNPAALNTQS